MRYFKDVQRFYDKRKLRPVWSYRGARRNADRIPAVYLKSGIMPASVCKEQRKRWGITRSEHDKYRWLKSQVFDA